MKKRYEEVKLSLLYVVEEDIVKTSLAQQDCFDETFEFNGWEAKEW